MINIKFKNITKLSDIEVTFRTTSTSESITLPTNGTNDYVVDWDDGSALETVNTSTPPVHIYAVAGDYDVKINGSLDKWNFYEINTRMSRDKVIKVNNFNAYKVGITDLSYAFYSCINLVSAKGFNFKNVTSLGYVFISCSSLPVLDVSDWDVSAVVDLTATFAGCSLITVFDASSWDTSNVTSMAATFSTTSLITLDLSNFDTSNVTDMRYMFNDCFSLTTLNLSNWDTSNVTNMDYMFYDCGNNLCITANNNFTTTQLPDRYNMFYDSNILHPTPAEQADLKDANGATYIYTGC